MGHLFDLLPLALALTVSTKTLPPAPTRLQSSSWRKEAGFHVVVQNPSPALKQFPFLSPLIQCCRLVLRPHPPPTSFSSESWRPVVMCVTCANPVSHTVPTPPTSHMYPPRLVLFSPSIQFVLDSNTTSTRARCDHRPCDSPHMLGSRMGERGDGDAVLYHQKCGRAGIHFHSILPPFDAKLRIRYLAWASENF